MTDSIPTRIPWDQLPALKASGWTVLSVTPLEGAETQICMAPPAPLAAPVPAIHRPRPAGLLSKAPERSSLTGELDLLRAQAWKHPGKAANKTLLRGLRLDLIAERSGTYRLLLARQGAAPSDQELATVLAHWPEPVGETSEPEHFMHGDWQCLKVMW
jgi:hypothetical protein